MAHRKPDKLVIAEDPKDFAPIQVDALDHEAIRKFLVENEGLTASQLAILCGRSSQTINRWRRTVKTGMRSTPFKRNHTKYKAIEVEHVTDPEIWDNRDWFHNQYIVQGRGIQLISRILRKQPHIVIAKLRKYKVQTRKHLDVVQSKNACCCEAWLYLHYATHQEYVEWCTEKQIVPNPMGGRALGLVECGKIAGVVPYTIMNWLTKFQMRIRGNGEASLIAQQRLHKSNAEPLLGKTSG